MPLQELFDARHNLRDGVQGDALASKLAAALSLNLVFTAKRQEVAAGAAGAAGGAGGAGGAGEAQAGLSAAAAGPADDAAPRRRAPRPDPQQREEAAPRFGGEGEAAAPRLSRKRKGGEGEAGEASGAGKAGGGEVQAGEAEPAAAAPRRRSPRSDPQQREEAVSLGEVADGPLAPKGGSGKGKRSGAPKTAPEPAFVAAAAAAAEAAAEAEAEAAAEAAAYSPISPDTPPEGSTETVLS